MGVCSAHAMFTGAPLGSDLVGKVHMENPSAKTVDDIHDHLGVKQLEVNVEIALIVKQDLPLTWTGSEHRTSHAVSVHVFLTT